LFSAIAWAAHYKQLEVMRWLIDNGAKVNEDREWHYLPSSSAAAAGFIEGLELLKEKGCDLSKANSIGFTPAHHAAIGGQQNIIQQLDEWNVPLDKKTMSRQKPADRADSHGHTQCADLTRRLVKQRTLHSPILQAITKAIAENNFALAHELFRS
jgi:ankyrin repeat protein